MTRPTPPHFVIDDMIPCARDAFSRLGSVTLLPARAITPASLRDAHALIVRSVIGVDAALLDRSPVQFVGTTTTGVDHIDQRYLAARNIEFAAALGCNADAVAEYVLTALLTVARTRGLALHGATIGIIGVGRIGSRVARMTQALGMSPVLHDPPLARATGDPRYRPLDEALRADVLTLHVPLTTDGPDPTRHLIGRDELARMTPAAILINTARGDVVDNHALHEALTGGAIRAAVMDVWEGEPSLNWPLLPLVALGTPHIAGHSFDGKVNGMVMIYHACCRFFDREPTWSPTAALSTSVAPRHYDGAGKDVQTLAHDVATTLYDLAGDHARMRDVLALPEAARPAAFDQLRRDYPQRRDFSASPVVIGHADKKIIFQLNELDIKARSI